VDFECDSASRSRDIHEYSLGFATSTSTDRIERIRLSARFVRRDSIATSCHVNSRGTIAFDHKAMKGSL
jgi:hypothetical protein